MFNNREVFQAVGGRPVLEKVHKIFYDKIYEHEWLGKFFEGIDQDFIEAQQTDFMSSISGGPKTYVGQPPQPSHMHMFLTDEIFEVRSQLLDESIREAGVPDEARKAWHKLDAHFRAAIIKKSVSECKQRYSFEPIVQHANPNPIPRAPLPAQTGDLDAVLALFSGRFGERGNKILVEALALRKQAGNSSEAGAVRVLRLLSEKLEGSEHMKLQLALKSGRGRGAA